jgi:hypothetical protein
MLNLPISATAEDIIAELNKLVAQIQEPQVLLWPPTVRTF